MRLQSQSSVCDDSQSCSSAHAGRVDAGAADILDNDVIMLSQEGGRCKPLKQLVLALQSAYVLLKSFNK